MKKYQNIILILIAVAAVFGLIWLSRSSRDNEGNSEAVSAGGGVLFAQEQSFDFGTISMAKGKVSHSFKVKNTGIGPMTINKIYTSCMCTVASLVKDGDEIGPFGMQGMGIIPNIKEKLEQGQEAEILVVFDPTAHGPAGVGRISRAVSVENSSGKLEFYFNANVTP